MPREGALTLALLYPEVLGTYGDRGNAVALAARAEHRGITVDTVEVPLGRIAPRADVYLLGGGEDAAIRLALEWMREDSALLRDLGDGATCLAVCAGLQLLGREIADPAAPPLRGLGLLDVVTERPRVRRAVGEIVVDSPVYGLLTGFENHQGRTRLGPAAQPLGRVRRGVGNGIGGDPADGGGRVEGAVQGGIVATYMHGPVLVRNPRLADALLERVTGTLPPLPGGEVDRLHRERLAAGLGWRRWTHPWWHGGQRDIWRPAG